MRAPTRHPRKPSTSRALAWLLLALPLASGCAMQGVISGRVRLAPAPRTTMPMPKGVATDPRAAVVYLESLPDTVAKHMAFSSGPDVAFFDEQRGGGFSPAVIAVPAGGTLICRNRDRVFHRVFSRAGPDSFDTGSIRPGESRSVNVGAPNRFLMFCIIHPDELGVVVVTPNRVYAQPSRDGTFHLPPLPLGHYELHAWHPAFGEVRRDVDMTDPRGAHVTIDF